MTKIQSLLNLLLIYFSSIIYRIPRLQSVTERGRAHPATGPFAHLIASRPHCLHQGTSVQVGTRVRAGELHLEAPSAGTGGPAAVARVHDQDLVPEPPHEVQAPADREAVALLRRILYAPHDDGPDGGGSGCHEPTTTVDDGQSSGGGFRPNDDALRFPQQCHDQFTILL